MVRPSIVKHSFTSTPPTAQQVMVGELVLRIYNQKATLFTKDENGNIIELGEGIFKFADLEDVDVTNLTEESFFVYRSGKFTATTQIGGLSSLSDVEISNPQAREYLRYDSLTESFRNYDPSYYLADLTDVEAAAPGDEDASSLQNDQVLVYDHPEGKFKPRPRRNLINELDDVEVVPPPTATQVLTYDSDGIWKNMNLKIERDPNPKLGADLDADGYSIVNSTYRVKKIVGLDPIYPVPYREGDYWVVKGLDSGVNPQCVLDLQIFPKPGTTAIMMLEIEQGTGNILIAGVENIQYEDGKPISLSGAGKTDLVTIMVQDALFVQRRFYHESSIAFPNRYGPVYPVLYPTLVHRYYEAASDVLGTTELDLTLIGQYFGVQSFADLNTLLNFANSQHGLDWVAIINSEDWMDQEEWFTQFDRIRYQNSSDIATDFLEDLTDLVGVVWTGEEAPDAEDVAAFDWGEEGNVSSLLSVPEGIPMRGKDSEGDIIDDAGFYDTVYYTIYDVTNQSYVRLLNPNEYLQYTYVGSFSIPAITANAIYQDDLLGYGGVVLYPRNPTYISNCRTGFGQIFGSQYFTTSALPDTYVYKENAFLFSDNDIWLDYFQSETANFGYSNAKVFWYTSPGGLNSSPIEAVLLEPPLVGFPSQAARSSSGGQLLLMVMRLMRELQETFTSWRDFILTWRAQPGYRGWPETPDWLLIWEVTATEYGYFDETEDTPAFIDIWRSVGSNPTVATIDLDIERQLLTPFNRNWGSDEWDREFDIGRYVVSQSLPERLALAGSGPTLIDIDDGTVTVREFVRRHGWQSRMIVEAGSPYTNTSETEGGDFNANAIKEGDAGGVDGEGNITGNGWVYSRYQDRYKAYVTLNALNLARSGLGGTPAYRYDKNRYPEVQVFDTPYLYDDYFDYVRLLLNFEPEVSTGLPWYEDKSDYYDAVADLYLANAVSTTATNIAIEQYSFGLQEYVARFLTAANTLDVVFEDTVSLSGDFTLELYIGFNTPADYLAATPLTYWLFRNEDDSFYLKYSGSSSLTQDTVLELKLGSDVYIYDNAYKYFSKEEGNLVHIAVVRKLDEVLFFVNGIYQNPNSNPTNSDTLGIEELNLTLKGDVNSVRLTEGVARYDQNFMIPNLRFGLVGGANGIQDKITFNTAYLLGDYTEVTDDYLATQIFY